MDIIGSYYRTILHDSATGETLFDISPNRTDNLPTRDGLLRCQGIINTYAKNIPLVLTGEIVDDIFVVEKEKFFSGTRESAIQFLDYAAKGLTDLQKKFICEIVKDDFLSYGMNPLRDTTEQIAAIVNNQSVCRSILNKARAIAANEAMARRLLNIGIPTDVISKICNDEHNLKMLDIDPYQLFIFHGLTAFHADNYLMQKIDPYAPVRIAGYVLDVIIQSEKSGNTCITAKKLISSVNYRLKSSIYPESHINGTCLMYVTETILGKIVKFYTFNDELYIYRQKVFEQETSLINQIIRLNLAKYDYSGIAPEIIEEESGIKYNDEQRLAFRLIRTSGIKILTGPPGTGKTTVIRGLIESYERDNPHSKVMLAATTGTAAQVLAEACGRPAQTIHRMLDIRPYGDNTSGKNINNPLEADLIIVDECSMLGLALADMLMQAVQSGTILILVGDADQLESVDYGNVFNDLIKSEKIEVCRLTQCLRQDNISIWENAQKVLNGDTNLITNENFVIHENMNTMNIRHDLLKNTNPMDDLILTPIRAGEIGVKELNRVLQEKMRMESYSTTNQSPCAVYARQHFYIGDKIMMTETNYKKEYFNGDVGVIEGISPAGELMCRVKYDIIPLDETDYRVMDLAYARTIHKLQGSEANTIYIALPETKMLSRRLLYTAITRAKKKVVILAVGDAVKVAIKNEHEHHRCTLLKFRLIDKVDTANVL